MTKSSKTQVAPEKTTPRQNRASETPCSQREKVTQDQLEALLLAQQSGDLEPELKRELIKKLIRRIKEKQ